MSPDSTTSPPEPDSWISEGFASLDQLRHAALLAPSDTLACKISARIAFMDELLVRHKALLNSCTSPLLRIPHEIQQHIIAYVTGDCEEAQEWIYLGHVCSALRNVLLNFHSLWGEAVCSFRSTRARDSALERAGPSAPLALSAYPGQGLPDACQFAISHLHRARSVDASHPSLVQHILDTDTPSLPCLEKIYLSANGRYQSAHDQPPKNTPRLKEVIIYGGFWNFYAPNLTMLEISYATLTNSQLFGLLQQSNFLRTLILYQSLPDFSDGLTSNSTINLPFLERMEVGPHEDRALQFWSLLCVPLDARIDFQLTDIPRMNASHSQPLGPARSLNMRVLRNHFGGLSPVKLCIDSITRDDQLGFDIFRNLDSTAESPDPTLSICYPNLDEPAFWELDALSKVCNEIGLSNITHFCHRHSFDNWDAERHGDEIDANMFAQHVSYWFAILASFRQLEHLEVWHVYNPLCAALGSPISHPPSSSGDVSTTPLLLPRLRHITLRDADMNSQGEGLLHSLWPKGFLDMVRFRTYEKQPLSTIQFHALNVASDKGNQNEQFLDTLRLQNPDCQIIVSV